MLYWAIKFPEKKPIGFLEFPRDQLVFYNGFFGIPSYIVWYCTPWPDKTVDIKVGDVFEFMVFEAPRTTYKDPDYESDFQIESFYFDVTKQVFRIVAVNRFNYLLSTTKLLRSLELTKRETPVSGIDVIEKLVEIATKGEQKKPRVSRSVATDRLEYVSINIDPDTSALDLITNICLENAWEFYIGRGADINGKRTDVLYISDMIYSTKYGLPFEPEAEHVKIMQTSLFKTMTTESVWTEPSLLVGNYGRIVWTKMYLGDNGGLMTIMIHKKKKPGEFTSSMFFEYLSENEYIKTLEGEARMRGNMRLDKILRSYSVILGKMYGNFDEDSKDNYESMFFSGDLDTYTKDLNTRSFKINYGAGEKPVIQNKNSKITTPYAGDGVGALYPQGESHRTLLTPDGERDVALVGPAYFGPNESVPRRINPEDYRLQLPDGASIYNENNVALSINGTTVHIFPGSKDNQDIPSYDETTSIDVSDGTITITVGAHSISISNSGITISGSNMDVFEPTLSVSMGQVEILGSLKVTGQVDMLAGKTVTIPNLDAGILKKIPPGP